MEVTKVWIDKHGFPVEFVEGRGWLHRLVRVCLHARRWGVYRPSSRCPHPNDRATYGVTTIGPPT